MNFSEKLKVLRKEAGLNQEEASKKIGIALSSLRKYEQVGKPDVPQLIKIKNFYNVSYDYLLNDKCNTKDIDNLEIVDRLGVRERTVKNIIKFKNKDFLDALFLNKYNEDVMECLEEMSQTHYMYFFILDRFLKDLCRTKRYNNIDDYGITRIKLLIDYLSRSKTKQKYWNLLIDNIEINNFIYSLEHILKCRTTNTEIYQEDIEMKYFNKELIVKIVEILTEYNNYCYHNFLNIITDFCTEYTENKIFNT